MAIFNTKFIYQNFYGRIVLMSSLCGPYYMRKTSIKLQEILKTFSKHKAVRFMADNPTLRLKKNYAEPTNAF